MAFDAPMGTDSDTAYAYDGEGRRVRKVVGGSSGVTTTYVYNVLGQLVAEFGGTAPARPGTRYLTPDHLGSTRVVTGEDQSVLTRHDYLPFGEEIGAALGNRNQASGVSGYTASLADGPAQKFTGKERDNESGLDYFQARYFSGAGGRFTSADVPFADQGAADPQSWNLYSYTRNNPLNYVDPDGRALFLIPIAQQYGPRLLQLVGRTGRGLWRGAKPYLTRAYNATTRFFNSQFGQEVTKATVEATVEGATDSGTTPRQASDAEVDTNPTEGAPASGEAETKPRRRVNKSKADPNAEGHPHSVFRTDAKGKVTNYTEFDASGKPVKRFRGTGRLHGGQKPPLIYQPKPGKGPGSPPKRARPPREEELPEGY